MSWILHKRNFINFEIDPESCIPCFLPERSDEIGFIWFKDTGYCPYPKSGEKKYSLWEAVYYFFRFLEQTEQEESRSVTREREDATLISEVTGCSHGYALSALRRFGGDIADAIERVINNPEE
jgi:hypothetical protein